MDNQNFSNPRIINDGIYPLLVVDLNGETVRVGLEQKAAFEYGLLFIGDYTLPTKMIPADLGAGRPVAQPVEGFTDDPRLLKLWLTFRQQADEGRAETGPLPMPPA